MAVSFYSHVYFCFVDANQALCVWSAGWVSRWSPLCAWHQASQQPVSVQRLLQRAALRAGLATKRGLAGAGFQELGAERGLWQWGGGGVPGASCEAAKGTGRERAWLSLMALPAYQGEGCSLPEGLSTRGMYPRFSLQITEISGATFKTFCQACDFLFSDSSFFTSLALYK